MNKCKCAMITVDIYAMITVGVVLVAVFDVFEDLGEKNGAKPRIT